MRTHSPAGRLTPSDRPAAYRTASVVSAIA